jgi:hypothetical protein
MAAAMGMQSHITHGRSLTCSGDDAMQPVYLLERLQDLLRESRYTTTYKFALLHALCDLALEMSPESSQLPLQRVAERIIELYWQQILPFSPPQADRSISLRMSTTPQAVAITLVRQLHARHQGRLSAARSSGRMREYSQSMLDVLKRDVLRRLQPTGSTPLLYRVPITGDNLDLLPGVPDTLRRFNGLLTDMIQSRWAAWVERVNPAIAGNDALRQHLFIPDRDTLRSVVPAMLDIQQGRCFYSHARITARGAHVDHFLPWSVTHNNSVGNLVLATAQANLAKRDRLPSKAKFRSWKQRNAEYSTELMRIASETGLPWQPDALTQLASWLYQRAG